MGTEAFWVPAVIAAVGTGAQYVNQQQATKRQNDAEVQAIQDQEANQTKAAGAAGALTRKIATDNPGAIKAQATGDYVKALRTAAGAAKGGTQTFGASTSALAPAAGASDRYTADKTAGDTQVQDYGQTYADEMGTIDAATRQRQNEGIGMGDLSTKINTLGAKSFGQNFVDQLRANVAGQTNPWVTLGAGLAKNGASAYAANPGVTPDPSSSIGGMWTAPRYNF